MNDSIKIIAAQLTEIKNLIAEHNVLLKQQSYDRKVNTAIIIVIVVLLVLLNVR